MKLLTLKLLILLVMNTISGNFNISCTFDNGTCGWLVTGLAQYKWTIHRGKTSNIYTGPDKDHTTASENGYYFYTKSQSQSKQNDVTDLLSGLINECPKQVLTFWYHMYGKHINTLKVFQVKNARLIELWRKSGTQRNKWHFQSLSLNDIGPYQILFRATRGNGYKSEIAVDDISINNTECNKVNNTRVTSDAIVTSDTSDTSDTSHTSDASNTISNTSVSSDTRDTRDSVTVGISSLVVIFIAALVFIIVICNRRRTSNHSQPSEVRANPTSTEMNSSLDNVAVNYIEMRDVSLPEIHQSRHESYIEMRGVTLPETRHENSSTHRKRQTTTAGIEQMGNYNNRYESLLTNRTSIEHIYESEYL